MEQKKKNGAFIAIAAMVFLFAMISFVTNMAAPFGTNRKLKYEWAGMVGNLMNFAAYLFMGIPAGMMELEVLLYSRWSQLSNLRSSYILHGPNYQTIASCPGRF